MGDEPNKLAEETAAPTESPAVTAEQAVPSAEESSAVQKADDVASESTAGETAAGETVEALPESGEGQQPEAVDEPAAGEVEETAGGVEESIVEETPSEEEEVVSEEVEDDVSEAQPLEEYAPEAEEEISMDWYILKVQSNREKSIAAALRRKIAVEGLENYFDDVVVPMEKVTEFKGGKKKIVERKLYPGYIVVHMHINDDTWFAVRETSGIGDFTGSGGKPTPMLPHEVARIIQTEEEVEEEAPKLNIGFKLGDRVKVKEGTFESFEGEVNSIDEHSGRITVMINIFGRSTPVELEYWQAEQI